MSEGETVIGLLEAQHDEIEGLLDGLIALMGSQREQAFLELRRLLAVHEAVEQQLVHPKAEQEHAGQPGARVGEENAAAELLTRLEGLDIESTEFETLFTGLAQSVRAHAETEELTEFAALQGGFDGSDLMRARQAVARVESAVTAMDMPFAAMREAALAALA